MDTFKRVLNCFAFGSIGRAAVDSTEAIMECGMNEKEVSTRKDFKDPVQSKKFESSTFSCSIKKATVKTLVQ